MNPGGGFLSGSFEQQVLFHCCQKFAEPQFMKAEKKKFSNEKTTIKIDCSAPVSDSLIATSELESFLQDKIKCYLGKKENFLSIGHDDNTVTVTFVGNYINKRGIKWQLNRFINMKRIKVFVKVFANGKDGLIVRYLHSEANREE
jgi:large subunit ribosomal protein L22e